MQLIEWQIMTSLADIRPCVCFTELEKHLKTRRLGGTERIREPPGGHACMYFIYVGRNIRITYVYIGLRCRSITRAMTSGVQSKSAPGGDLICRPRHKKISKT